LVKWRWLFHLKSKIAPNQAPQIKFVAHQEDKMTKARWEDLANKLSAKRKNNLMTIANKVTNKLSDTLEGLFEETCPKCKQKGSIKSTRISKDYLDKVYKQTTASAIRGVGGRHDMGGYTPPEYVWYLIYQVTEQHECKKCSHHWQTTSNVEERA
jgi:hypothetical protein